jgi:threonine dehydratase
MITDMFSLPELEAALTLVRHSFPGTPQYPWPLLAERTGAEVWVKHENHTPIGAFKLRGGLVYAERLRRERPYVRGIVTATRGNHGQSLAWAGRRYGITVTVIVPRGNAVEKNAAMRAFGARLIEYGEDFDAARDEAARRAAIDGLEFAPSFAPDLVKGVATYSLELFRAAPPLDALYVPIGLGSGICGAILVRDLLGLKTEIVGVQAAGARPTPGHSQPAAWCR